MRALSLCTAFILTLAVVPASSHAEEDLAPQAHALLKKYCYQCHGSSFEGNSEFNVLDRDILVQSRGEEELPYLAPGKPGNSYLWKRIASQEMPPEGAPQMSSEDKALLKQWIEQEAPFPVAQTRSLVTQKEVFESASDYLRAQKGNDRPFIRFFTLTHLYNNLKVTDVELRLYRAGLAKALNSMTWKRDLVKPVPVDPQQTVFAVDLRDLDWDPQGNWTVVEKAYPYGLRYDINGPLQEVAETVYDLADTEMPMIRADWFVAKATRPGIYEELLDLPDTLAELEEELGVERKDDFLENRLARAAFAVSGVSAQNRLVDRHNANFGYYWLSYDFTSPTSGKHENPDEIDLVKRPLGPEFEDHPFPNQAFKHDGGEAIFSLPNGLQGYFLVDAKGDTIKDGPIDVVSDALKTSGSPVIVNGLSCMGCHRYGVIRFKDSIRDGVAVFGRARQKVEDLFPSREKMDQLLSRDDRLFMNSIDDLLAPILQVEEDKQKDIREFPEPVGALARLYNKDLGIEEVALELGMTDPESLAASIRASSRLRTLGLAPLAQGEKIKRALWDSQAKVLSTLQLTASELDLGTPHRKF